MEKTLLKKVLTEKGGGICGGACIGRTPTYTPIPLVKVVFQWTLENNRENSRYSRLLFIVLKVHDAD